MTPFRRRALAPLLAGLLACLAPALHAAPPVRHIAVDVDGPKAPLDRFFDLSVGSTYAGRLGRADALAQLKTEHDELGFRYVRFHDIFADGLGTYRVVHGKPVYDWHGIDRLYDHLLAIGVRPFVELGFTPKAMRTSKQTIFYWKGNTSVPRMKPWAALVAAFLRHLEKRYGTREVRRWYFEVWNEPNLSGFLQGGKQKTYFHLYDVTARTLKRIDPKLRVGGPATAGAAWIPAFIAHCVHAHTPLDFISTHTYGVTSGFLDADGKADNKLSPSPGAIVGDVRRVRRQIRASARPHLPLFITEWSTSYSPRDPVHDDYISAAYILSKLEATQGLAQGMSYWTFSDLFMEPGPPTAPFQGGFGLMNPQGIRKPAYFAYKYLHELGRTELQTADRQSHITWDHGVLKALVWDFVTPQQKAADHDYYTKVHPARPAPPVSLDLSHLPPGTYRVAIHRTGYRANDAYTAYLRMGAPSSLSAAQKAKLQTLTRDTPTVRRLTVGSDGTAHLRLPMRSNDVVLVSLRPVTAP